MASRMKSKKPLDERKRESKSVREKYPDRVPVICEKHDKAMTMVDIDKKKYLVPSDLPVAQFIVVIRKRLRLTREQAIFLFVNGHIPSTNALMNQIYDEHRDEDGFLYITYAPESTFGSCFESELDAETELESGGTVCR